MKPGQRSGRSRRIRLPLPSIKVKRAPSGTFRSSGQLLQLPRLGRFDKTRIEGIPSFQLAPQLTRRKRQQIRAQLKDKNAS